MLEVPRFIKKKENFICGHCGTKIQGNGFTNHCPKCLYSKHVDVNPGDRQASCGGMMKPISIQLKHGEKRILHECKKCGHEKINKIAPGDSEEEILKLFNA